MSEATDIDGQRARARSRVAPDACASAVFAMLGAVLTAALLVLCSYAGRSYAEPLLLAGAYLLSGLMVAVGWARLLCLPRERSSALVLGVAAAAMTAIVALTDDLEGIRWVTAALAISLALVFLHTLTRRGGPGRVVVSLSSMALGLGALASGAFIADAVLRENGRETVVAALAAAAVGAVIDNGLRGNARLSQWRLPTSLVVGVLIGVGTSMVAGIPWNAPLLAGLLGAGMSHAFREIISAPVARAGIDRSGTAPAQLALGAASVLFVGVLPTVVIWLFQRIS